MGINSVLIIFLYTNFLKRKITSMSFLSINPVFLLSMPSGGEWLIIGLVVVVLFGGKKIPELAKGLGKGIREFNDAKKGIKDEIEAGMKESDKPAK